MSRKRPISEEATDTSGPEVKKQKTLPHRGKAEAAKQTILDWLSPATQGPLSDFNSLERKEGRRGVFPIDTAQLQSEFDDLLAGKDIDTLDAKLSDIDTLLAGAQAEYEEYTEKTAATGEKLIERTTKNLVWRIKKARNDLPNLRVILLSKPPPSDYAKGKNWAGLQTLPLPMLCMRPVKCRGLPIFLLHEVFARYLSLRKETLPATPEARTALHVARELCNTMGDYFGNEIARRDAFLRAIRPLFTQWTTTMEVTPQGATAPTRTDVTISVNRIVLVIIEIKNERERDAYMQASRGYEVITEAIPERHSGFLARGAPAFISCLNNDELRIAGAFKDGEQTVVEPLSNSLLYPDYRRDGRTMELAQDLFALSSCLSCIAQEIDSPGPPVSAVDCPRVFSAVHNPETNQDERLEFSLLRKDLWETSFGTIDYRNLIYNANLGGVEVLAKVVQPSYGKNVHALLAARRMAPRLYGTSDLHDLASVVVMEFLKDGWVTLFYYRTNMHGNAGIPEGPRERLVKRLEEMLDCLRDNGMVHGDFRMANVMLKPGEEENAVLIDFDWAGEAGTARYPLTRSDGFGYRGEPGGPIGAEDDRRFYETWKDEI